MTRRNVKMLRTGWLLRYSACALFLATAIVHANSAAAAERDAEILTSDLEWESVRLLSINHEYVHLALGGNQSTTLPLRRALGIVFGERQSNGEHWTAAGDGLRAGGTLTLADGQRYIGRLIGMRDSEASDDEMSRDTIAWLHPVLGELQFKLDEVKQVLLTPDARPVKPEAADVVVLKNGDELRGFIVAIGDPIEIEIAGGSNGGAESGVMRLPLDRVASVNLIAPSRSAAGQRLWLNDGTIMHISGMRMPAEGDVEVTGRWQGSGTQTANLPREMIAAVLTDAQRIVSLSSLSPTRVEGPATRFRIPRPRVLDDDSLLGLSPIEFHGPLTAHYALPTGSVRFAAEAVLPRESRTWGDFELVVRIDGRDIERRRMNASQPTASFNFEVDGAELTIELLEGESGPIQNHVILSRAAILIQSESR